MASLKKVQGLDDATSTLQTNVADALTPLLNNPRAGSIILTGLQLVAGTNVIPHKLGRKLQGWDVIRQRGAPGVFASYNTATAQSLPNNSFTTINYDTKVTDTDNAVTTGAGWQFKCPNGKGGNYLVTTSAAVTAAPSTVTDATITICKNGNELYRGARSTMTTGTASIVGVCVSGQVALSAGDTTQVKVYQNTGATRSLEAQTISNWIQIIRLDGVSTPPIYDTQDSNSTPDKTLVLVSAFPVTIDLEVF